MVEIIVPWRGGCSYRERAFSWVRARLSYPVRVAEGGEPWIKADAVNTAVAASGAEIVVVHDADVWCGELEAAVEAVRDGDPWAIPHKGVHRLTAEGSEAFMRGEPWEEQPLEQRAYRGTEGGGIVVLRREVALEVPVDRRFVGWGQEDETWGQALGTLAGAPWHGKAPLIHLWHPPQERSSRRWGSAQGRVLARRYRRAVGLPEQMRRVMEKEA